MKKLIFFASIFVALTMKAQIKAPITEAMSLHIQEEFPGYTTAKVLAETKIIELEKVTDQDFRNYRAYTQEDGVWDWRKAELNTGDTVLVFKKMYYFNKTQGVFLSKGDMAITEREDRIRFKDKVSLEEMAGKTQQVIRIVGSTIYAIRQQGGLGSMRVNPYRTF